MFQAKSIYIFEAFDESEKPGDEVERNFGIASENKELKFQLPSQSGPAPGPGPEAPCTEWGWRFYDQHDIGNNDINHVPAGMVGIQIPVLTNWFLRNNEDETEMCLQMFFYSSSSSFDN